MRDQRQRSHHEEEHHQVQPTAAQDAAKVQAVIGDPLAEHEPNDQRGHEHVGRHAARRPEEQLGQLPVLDCVGPLVDPSGQVGGAQPFQQGRHLTETAAAKNIVLQREHDAGGHEDDNHLAVEFRVLGGMPGRFVLRVLENGG